MQCEKKDTPKLEATEELYPKGDIPGISSCFSYFYGEQVY